MVDIAKKGLLKLVPGTSPLKASFVLVCFGARHQNGQCCGRMAYMPQPIFSAAPWELVSLALVPGTNWSAGRYPLNGFKLVPGTKNDS